MEITLSTTQTAFELADVRSVVDAALSREVGLARARREAYERKCREFEARFNMSSNAFLSDFEAGKLGDDLEMFDWYAAKKGLDFWDRQTTILAGVVV